MPTDSDMACPRCGRPADSGAKACPACKEPLPAASPTLAQTDVGLHVALFGRTTDAGPVTPLPHTIGPVTPAPRAARSRVPADARSP